MFQKYSWIFIYSLISRLHAACTSKIMIKSKIDDGDVNVGFFSTLSDNVELDAKVFCAKFSISTETCTTVITYHKENCMSDEDLYRVMAFIKPDECYTGKSLNVIPSFCNTSTSSINTNPALPLLFINVQRVNVL